MNHIIKKGGGFLMSIRITNHSARGGTDGPFLPGHNDRSKTQNAEHINKEKSNLNFYYTVTGIPDFEKNELVFYEKNFSQHLELQNQRYKKNRHKEKIKTMEEYLKGKYTRPDETILQIGNKNDHPDPEISKSIILEFMQWHVDKMNAPGSYNFHQEYLPDVCPWGYRFWQDNGQHPPGAREYYARPDRELQSVE